MKSLDSFIKAVQPKRRVSKLNKFKDEIFELYNGGYKISQIQQFLVENDIKISKRRIWGFIAKKDVVVKKITTVEKKQTDGATTTTTTSKALSHFLNNVEKQK